jgi:hypothetical protein
VKRNVIMISFYWTQTRLAPMFGTAEDRRSPAKSFSERNEMTFYNCSSKTDTKLVALIRWTEVGSACRYSVSSVERWLAKGQRGSVLIENHHTSSQHEFSRQAAAPLVAAKHFDTEVATLS